MGGAACIYIVYVCVYACARTCVCVQVSGLASTEKEVISVERCVEYMTHADVDATVLQEPHHAQGTPGEAHTHTHTEPLLGAPRMSAPVCVFEGVALQYGATRALDGVTLAIARGERVGIVGHTGAGKSSLLQCLFRIRECSEGFIRVGGTELSELPHAELRRRLAIVPQSAVLFPPDLRSNLDPFREHSDEEIYRVLGQCSVLERVLQLPAGLQFPITGCGTENELLSSGEMQLLCVARALLKPQAQLLCMDESTASIDITTTQTICDALKRPSPALRGKGDRKEASQSMLVIAHRLSVVTALCDRVLVMDQGRVVEQGCPRDLLLQPGSKFKALHDQE